MLDERELDEKIEKFLRRKFRQYPGLKERTARYSPTHDNTNKNANTKAGWIKQPGKRLGLHPL